MRSWSADPRRMLRTQGPPFRIVLLDDRTREVGDGWGRQFHEALAAAVSDALERERP